MENSYKKINSNFLTSQLLMNIVLDTNLLIDGSADDYNFGSRIIDEVLAGNLNAFANRSTLAENRLMAGRKISDGQIQNSPWANTNSPWAIKGSPWANTNSLCVGSKLPVGGHKKTPPKRGCTNQIPLTIKPYPMKKQR